MRGHRLINKPPTTHPDFTFVDWSSEDYNFMIRHFGCFPHSNNGNSEKSKYRGGRVLSKGSKLLQNKNNENMWWKIKSINFQAEDIMKSIDYEFLVSFASVRLLKENLCMLYDVTKELHERS